MTWKDDAELFQLARAELYTAVVGDILDQIGLLRQFLPPQIRCLHDDMILVGRAMTVLQADYWDSEDSKATDSSLRKPFGLMLEALDDLQMNEVYLCSGGTGNYALWGELMSARAIKCGAVGAVLDGYHRDTKGIHELNFPTFSRGSFAQDQAPRGKVIDFRCALEIDGVRIESGDIIFGDVDGVVVVPTQTVTEVFSRSIEKARGEKTVRKAIEQGMTAGEAFEKYGIL